MIYNCVLKVFLLDQGNVCPFSGLTPASFRRDLSRCASEGHMRNLGLDKVCHMQDICCMPYLLYYYTTESYKASILRSLSKCVNNQIYLED